MGHISSDSVVEIILALIAAIGAIVVAIAGWFASSMRDLSKDTSESIKEVSHEVSKSLQEISKDVGNMKGLLGEYFQKLEHHKERTAEKLSDAENEIKELKARLK